MLKKIEDFFIGVYTKLNLNSSIILKVKTILYLNLISIMICLSLGVTYIFIRNAEVGYTLLANCIFLIVSLILLKFDRRNYAGLVTVATLLIYGIIRMILVNNQNYYMIALFFMLALALIGMLSDSKRYIIITYVFSLIVLFYYIFIHLKSALNSDTLLEILPILILYSLSFSVFIMKLQIDSANINDIKNNMHKKEESLKKLSKIVDKTKDSLSTSNELITISKKSTEYASSMNGKIMGMNVKFKNIKYNITSLISNIEHTTIKQKNSIKELSLQFKNSSEMMKHSTENLVGKNDDLKRKLEEKSLLVKNIIIQSQSYEKTLQEGFLELNGIVKRFRSIEDIMNIIQGVAAQTHMLAMNAAIQAAQAGESGKSFSVVAVEIRNLAETSTDFLEKIRKITKENNKSLDKSLALNNSINEIFQDVLESFKELGSTIIEIAESSDLTYREFEQIQKATNILESQNVQIQNFIEQVHENLNKVSTDLYQENLDLETLLTDAEHIATFANNVNNLNISLHKIVNDNMDNLEKINSYSKSNDSKFMSE